MQIIHAGMDLITVCYAENCSFKLCVVLCIYCSLDMCSLNLCCLSIFIPIKVFCIHSFCEHFHKIYISDTFWEQKKKRNLLFHFSFVLLLLFELLKYTKKKNPSSNL